MPLVRGFGKPRELGGEARLMNLVKVGLVSPVKLSRFTHYSKG